MMRFFLSLGLTATLGSPVRLGRARLRQVALDWPGIEDAAASEAAASPLPAAGAPRCGRPGRAVGVGNDGAAQQARAPERSQNPAGRHACRIVVVETDS